MKPGNFSTRMLRIFIFLISMATAFALIGYIFWEEDIKYSLPTPVPADFREVATGQKISLEKFLKTDSQKPVFLHFYNPRCPCSRFNAEEFRSLVKLYSSSIDFRVIIQSENENAVNKFRNKYALDVPVIFDRDGKISDECGIYSTPQAVILDQNSVIYYKGNYNKARFCNSKETRFAAKALDHLIAGEKLPAFSAEAPR